MNARLEMITKQPKTPTLTLISTLDSKIGRMEERYKQRETELRTVAEDVQARSRQEMVRSLYIHQLFFIFHFSFFNYHFLFFGVCYIFNFCIIYIWFLFIFNCLLTFFFLCFIDYFYYWIIDGCAKKT